MIEKTTVYKQKSTLDFRTLLFLDTLILLFLILSGRPEVVIATFLVALAVTLFMREFRTACKYTVLFTFLTLYYFLFLHMSNSQGITPFFAVIGIIAFILQRIIPLLMLATVITRRKNIAEIATSLERCRLPKGIILCMIVSIRYLPTMREDFITIVEAMKLKGIDTSFQGVVFHPLRIITFLIVPMLFRSLRTTEEFSCATLVKGIENRGQRSSYFDVRLRSADFLFPLCAIVILTSASFVKFL